MKRKVLFVDDEPRVLQGLKRMLRNIRNDWDMGFAESGAEALTILQNEMYDVVVTDMRMPGMDGSQLLEIIKDKYPQMVRIVLSGHSDQDMILKSVMPAHQYLSKPCDAETIKATILKACKLQDLLENDVIKKLVSRLESLPSLPSIYCEIVEEMESPEPSIKNVGNIIEKDISMSAKMLQLVNSAFFGLPRHISSPSHAVSMLGMDVVKSLVLSIHVFSQFQQNQISHFSLNKLWEHSTSVSKFTKKILELEQVDVTLADNGFLAAMLHDIGKLILAAQMSDQYDEVIHLVEKENFEIHLAEENIFSTTHSSVGAYLLGLWGLPNTVVETVAFHHDISNHSGNQMFPLVAVYYSDYIDYQLHPNHQMGAMKILDKESMAKCPCKCPQNVWFQECKALSEGSAGGK